jgi:pyruvate/2-oxoglutarate dehydrogenase complex dihydrolipoamide dehydrogenase (E3) component
VEQRADVVVLGMGPGGEEVAGRLLEAGLDVVGVEGRLLGGECPYWGCVPSKMMLRAAGLLADARRVTGMAGSASVTPDWDPLARRIREEATDDWNDKVAVNRFESNGGRFVRGWGRLSGPGRVVVDDVEFHASKAVVLATGTRPWAPPVAGLADAGFWTNREAIETEVVPRSLLVLGGGAIGVELAQVFARFGSHVRVLEMAPQLLPAEEPEAAALLEDALLSEGVEISTGVEVKGARRDQEGVSIELADGWTPSFEQLLVATGRRADLAALGVGSVGIDDGARFVSVDDHLRAATGTWAVGDVTGVGAFTHVAVYQGRIAASDILGEDVPGADYRALPRVTFTDPEVGSVGLSEAAARQKGIAVRVGVSDVSKSARGWIQKVDNRGVLKLVEDAGRGILAGATSVGPAGGEIVGFLQLAVQSRVPTSELSRMIYAYPTFTRALEPALQELLR